MALTLDGTTTLPMMGGMGTGSGVGLGAVGGGVAGLILGSLIGNNGGGLFGGNGNASNAQFDAIQTQISGLQGQMNSAGMHSEINELENQLSAANIANLQGIAANALAYTNGNAAIQTSLANGNSIYFDKFNEFDWYYALNMIYSDFAKTIGDNTSMYVLLAKDWIMDEDAPEGKDFKYWKAMKY